MREEVLYLEQRPVLFYFPQMQAKRTTQMLTSKLDISDTLQESRETFRTYDSFFEPALKTDNIEL